MTILDTLIAQSEQLSPPSQPYPERNTATFRQEVMGALALFTGGRSLASPEQEHTGRAGIHIADGSAPSLTPAPDPPAMHEDAGIATQKQPIQGAASPARAAPTAHTSQDWSTLLARSDHTTRQALKEVEPTLHNAEQSLNRFIHLQTRLTDDGKTGTDPATILKGLSASMTARSILNLHAPTDLLPNTAIQQASVIPQQPATARPALSSSPVGAVPHDVRMEPAQAGNQLKRLSQSLSRTEQIIAQMMPVSAPPFSSSLPDRTASGQSLSRLVRHAETASPPRQVTTHNTTTHSPTIHITVEAGHGRPQDIARAVEASTINALTRQTLAQTG